MARPPGSIEVDINAPASLARFALAARVDRLGARSTTARRVGLTDSNFAKRLERLSGSSGAFVAQVDRALAAPTAGITTGGLARVIGHHAFLDQAHIDRPTDASHTMSLRAQWGDLFPADVAPLEVPGSMFAGLRRAGPARNGSEVTVRAAALLALLNGLRSMPPTARLAELERLGDAVPSTIDELLTVASGPVGPAQAVALAARFGEHSLASAWDHLNRSPLGYRVMRVIINLLRLVQAKGPGEPWDGPLRREILSAINKILRDLRQSERPDAYPGRTLTVSAYLVCPSTPEFAWTTDALADLAWFGGTVRERGHSALALAQRSDPTVPRLIQAFRQDPRRDVGLGFLADMLEFGTMPVTSIEYLAVHAALSRCRDDTTLSRTDPTWLPPSVEHAARALVAVAALHVDALLRRRACEALNAALAGPATVEILIDLLQTKNERLALVHQNATLSLSFLGQPSACPALLAVAADPFYDSETRATALWTVGDLSSLIAPADWIPTVEAVSALFARPQSVELQRSAAYTLALLRAEPDRLLQWSDSPDPLTRGLADWGCRRIRIAELRAQQWLPTDVLVVSPLAPR